MTEELSAALELAYRLSVRDRGFNNPLTREIAALIIRFKGVQAKRVLDEIVRAQNALSKGVSVDSLAMVTTPEPPQPEAQPKKSQPQEAKNQKATPKSENQQPLSDSPPAAVVEVITSEDIKGMTALSVSEKYPRAVLVKTLSKVKPAEKPEGYTERQIAAIILNQFKNADKLKRT
jgi:hypothetical protein